MRVQQISRKEAANRAGADRRPLICLIVHDDQRNIYTVKHSSHGASMVLPASPALENDVESNKVNLNNAARDLLDMCMGPLTELYPSCTWAGTLSLFFKEELSADRPLYVFAANIGEVFTKEFDRFGKKRSPLADVWEQRRSCIQHSRHLPQAFGPYADL